MKETGGTANPRVVSELVRARLIELTLEGESLAKGWLATAAFAGQASSGDAPDSDLARGDAVRGCERARRARDRLPRPRDAGRRPARLSRTRPAGRPDPRHARAGRACRRRQGAAELARAGRVARRRRFCRPGAPRAADPHRPRSRSSSQARCCGSGSHCSCRLPSRSGRSPGGSPTTSLPPCDARFLGSRASWSCGSRACRDPARPLSYSLIPRAALPSPPEPRSRRNGPTRPSGGRPIQEDSCVTHSSSRAVALVAVAVPTAATAQVAAVKPVVITVTVVERQARRRDRAAFRQEG